MRIALTFVLMAVGAWAPAAAAARAPIPVKVVSKKVTLARAGEARVAVRCRTHRPCHGVVSLGVPDRDLPVSCSTCNVGIGHARFTIPARRTRTVSVSRGGGDDVSYSADSLSVRAIAWLDGERYDEEEAARRVRFVRLLAPPELPRPRTGLSLIDIVSRWGLDRQSDGNALRFEVRAPRGTDAVRVQVRDRVLDLHPAMGGGAYYLPRGSYAPAGMILHGELPIGRDEFHYGVRYPVRVTACQLDACEALAVERKISRGAYGEPGPICSLRTGSEGTAALAPLAVHPSPLAVLVAAPGG